MAPVLVLGHRSDVHVAEGINVLPARRRKTNARRPSQSVWPRQYLFIAGPELAKYLRHPCDRPGPPIHGKKLHLTSVVSFPTALFPPHSDQRRDGPPILASTSRLCRRMILSIVFY